ncbi:vitamin K epoxide reductase family protein [Candidatus Uhrbacteria bacterium]|nr:vitamin K epoxide reductase family protein [Candidatus Uhrbacteria bacterium]
MTIYVATFLGLAILGLADTGYLAFRHTRKKPLVCPLDHDCSKVTESKWSSVLGIRNEYLGVLYYAGMVIGMAAAFILTAWQPLLILLMFFSASIGVLYSLFLVAVQFVLIKDYCFYCLVSAGITFLLFLNIITLLGAVTK